MPTTEKDETGWWVRATTVASLYRFLVHKGQLDPSNVDAVTRFLQRPWAFSAEHAEMKLADVVERGRKTS